MSTNLELSSPAPLTAKVTVRQDLPFAVPLADRVRFDKLPSKVREDVQLLLLTLEKIHRSNTVKGGCKAHALNRRGFTPASLRRKYYLYRDHGGDWLALVDAAKAPTEKSGLSEEFLDYW